MWGGDGENPGSRIGLLDFLLPTSSLPVGMARVPSLVNAKNLSYGPCGNGKTQSWNQPEDDTRSIAG